MSASSQWCFILHELPNEANSSHESIVILKITVLFLLSLLLFVLRFPKKISIFPVWNQLPQASKQKETYFANRKILQNFEGHDDWNCRHITFWVIYNSQRGQNNCGEIRAFDSARGISRYSSPWYWFYRWGSSSMWCSSSKNTLVGYTNLQMITKKF